MATSTDRCASPARGQAWKLKRGCGQLLFIMAVADGWVLARYKGCIPFALLRERPSPLLQTVFNVGTLKEDICTT